jgi:hypothetical protein
MNLKNGFRREWRSFGFGHPKWFGTKSKMS